jgi:hypothetical protein
MAAVMTVRFAIITVLAGFGLIDRERHRDRDDKRSSREAEKN